MTAYPTCTASVCMLVDVAVVFAPDHQVAVLHHLSLSESDKRRGIRG